ncbi:hypothetical protein [Legionella quateirensis]|uniref:hypothetical protein n=1 Tax=Legionella quateirensis TaxID=45072 RepID=UPI00155974A0|nr:hypothetical protein [Legionella quateirensis]
MDKKARRLWRSATFDINQQYDPSAHYQMQYTLSNQKRADCILFLPEPTGNVVIDAKFPWKPINA